MGPAPFCWATDYWTHWNAAPSAMISGFVLRHLNCCSRFRTIFLRRYAVWHRAHNLKRRKAHNYRPRMALECISMYWYSYGKWQIYIHDLPMRNSVLLGISRFKLPKATDCGKHLLNTKLANRSDLLPGHHLESLWGPFPAQKSIQTITDSSGLHISAAHHVLFRNQTRKLDSALSFSGSAANLGDAAREYPSGPMIFHIFPHGQQTLLIALLERWFGNFFVKNGMVSPRSSSIASTIGVGFRLPIWAAKPLMFQAL